MERGSQIPRLRFLSLTLQSSAWDDKLKRAIPKLVELCGKFDSSFEELKEDAIFLTEFYIPVRYPGDYPEFSWSEAEQDFKAAVKIKEFVLRRIKEI